MKNKKRLFIPKFSNPKEGISFADVMKKGLSDMNLQEIGVDVRCTLRTKFGAILLEVKDREEAEPLAELLISVIGDRAYVSRPSRSTKILVVNIAD